MTLRSVFTIVEVLSYLLQADSSKLQFEAMQYGFFADGGAGESLELDIGGIEVGIVCCRGDPWIQE